MIRQCKFRLMSSNEEMCALGYLFYQNGYSRELTNFFANSSTCPSDILDMARDIATANDYGTPQELNEVLTRYGFHFRINEVTGEWVPYENNLKNIMRVAVGCA